MYFCREKIHTNTAKKNVVDIHISKINTVQTSNNYYYY